MLLLALVVVSCTGPGRQRAGPPSPTAVEVPPPTGSAVSEPGPASAAGPELVSAESSADLVCPTSCDGQIGEAEIATFQKQVANVRRCYDRQLKTDPSLQGRMVLELVILRDSRVCSVRLMENEIDSPELASCVRSFFQGIQIAPTGGCVIVRQPLSFKTAETDAGP